MKIKKLQFFILLVSFCVKFIEVNALKCITEDGLTDDQVKKVIRKCMSKTTEFGNQDYHDNSDNYSDRDRERFRIRNRPQGSNNGGGNNENRWRRSEQNRKNIKDNRSVNRTNQRNNSNSRNSTTLNNYYGHNNNQNNDGRCIVHCFFKELNMVNGDDFPEKHKVLNVVTNELRDRELRNFYIDTIQDCFRFIEMENNRIEKCEFSQSLIDCMANYASVNCEDWKGQTMIFT